MNNFDFSQYDVGTNIGEDMREIKELVSDCVYCDFKLQNGDFNDEDKQLLIKANESNIETLSYLLQRTFVKIFNAGYKIHKKIRDLLDDYRDNLEKVSDLWENRIRKNLNNINNEKLSDKELELYPCDEWVVIAKVTLKVFNFCSKIEEICNDENSEMMTNYMKEIKNDLDRIGVEISVGRLTANYDELLDKRKYQSITELGYNKAQYPTLFRYANELSKYIPKDESHSLLIKKHNDYLHKLTQEASNVKDAFSKGKIKKENGEYQARNEKLIHQMVRAGFCYCVLGVGFNLAKYLIKDIFKMFSAVEDLISLKD